jgi:hypothetical protein
MLVTTAVDPPRRPTSDPKPQLAVGAGYSLRRAPDDDTSDQDAVLDQAYLLLAAGSLGRSRRQAPMRSAGRVAPTADNITCCVRRPEIRPAGPPNG